MNFKKNVFWLSVSNLAFHSHIISHLAKDESLFEREEEIEREHLVWRLIKKRIIFTHSKQFATNRKIRWNEPLECHCRKFSFSLCSSCKFSIDNTMFACVFCGCVCVYRQTNESFSNNELKPNFIIINTAKAVRTIVYIFYRIWCLFSQNSWNVWAKALRCSFESVKKEEKEV